MNPKPKPETRKTNLNPVWATQCVSWVYLPTYVYHKKSAIHVGKYYHKMMVTLGNQPIQKMVASWTFRVDGLHWVKVWILGCLFECIDPVFCLRSGVWWNCVSFFFWDLLSFGVSILLDVNLYNVFRSSLHPRFIWPSGFFVRTFTSHQQRRVNHLMTMFLPWLIHRDLSKLKQKNWRNVMIFQP